MPLIKSRSKRALKSNIKTEMEANPSPKDRSQNLAIAYATQRAASKKMADGGEVRHIRASTNPKSYARGIHQSPDWQPEKGKSYAGTMLRESRTSPGGHSQGASEEAREAHREVMEEMKGMKKPNLYAEGGMACPPDCPECLTKNMVHALRKKFAKGGEVRPVDHNSIEEDYAETFDDMNEEMADGHLYDDSQISAQPKDSNEHGDMLEDEDEHGKSMFKKIKMKKAKKSDRGDF